jgi:translation initiation factor IF-3
VNRRIRVPEVRVIGADGTQLGIMPTDQALRSAEESGLDLVEVSPKAVPPVCRIMDYGKFKYEQSKQQAKAKKHQSTVTLKEIKFRPKTDDHDFDFKVRHIRRFLQEGNKAKLVIIFRGREIVHPETGQAMLKAVYEACSDIGMIEQAPMMEGRRMLMIIAPRGGVIKTAPLPTAPRPVSTGPGAAPASGGAASPGASAVPPSAPEAPASATAAPVSAPTAAASAPTAPASAPTAPASAPTAPASAPAAPASAPAAPASAPAAPASAPAASARPASSPSAGGPATGSRPIRPSSASAKRSK